jgi:hypothetical protein
LADAYDVIGDVHGCASKLKGLLAALGYETRSGVHRHPERQAIFIGDIIDRGDEHKETIDLIRAMVDAESAYLVMVNHEFNAISYATPNPEIPGEYMRPRNEKNRRNHEAFLEQVQLHRGFYASCIEWFKTLPRYLDLGGLRVIHACWNDKALDVLNRAMKPGEPMSTEFVVKANQKGAPEHEAIEVLLKGPETNLREYGQPDFQYPGDRVRHEARIRWWNPGGRTLRELVEIAPGTVTSTGDPYPELPDDRCREHETAYDYGTEKPIVFYGHYWRKWNPDRLPEWAPEKGLDWTKNTVCVDFSAVRGGPLVAYRRDGEVEADPAKFVPYPET